MKKRLCFLFLMMVRATLADEGALPQWGPVDSMLYSTESPLEAPLGGGLWPPDYYPLPRDPEERDVAWALQVLKERKEAHEKQGEEPVVVVVPEKKPEPLPIQEPEPPVVPFREPLVTLTKVQADVRLVPPDKGRIVDRAGALTPEKRMNFERFLEFHAEDSTLPLGLALLESNERLPSGYDARRVAREWFGDKPGCLVVYTMGDPRRAEVILNGGLAGRGGASREAVLSSQAISDALAARGEVDQLDRFLAQVSVRIFWLEKTERGNLDGPVAVVSAATTGVPVKRDLRQPLVLGLAGLGAAGAAFWLLKLRRDRRENCVWLFPDRECVERFGGKHAGGGHVVISFEPGQTERGRRVLPEKTGAKHDAG